MMSYVGGTSDTDGTAEDYQDSKPEENVNYFMKGYMLRFTLPDEPAGNATWSMKKAGNEVGSWHDGGAWTDYETRRQGPPTGRTAYWRSDLDGTITDAYTLSVTYTPAGKQQQTTVTLSLASRLLDPDVADLRDNFHNDTDMCQRAMIQVFYLNKGRLNSYRIGKYDKADSTNPNGPHGYYVTNRPAGTKWSSIADEVWNFDKFALGTGAPDVKLQLRIVQDIWAEFALILAAPLPNGITTQTAQYVNQWLPNASQNYGVPNGFGANNADTMNAQVIQEGGIHSYDRHAPLAVSALQIGENAAGVDAAKHDFTDGGLGFAKVQPYNKGTSNLYTPDGNLGRMAAIMNGNFANAPGADVNEQTWRALFKYNFGTYQSNVAIATLRTQATTKRSAAYADGIFTRLNIQLP